MPTTTNPLDALLWVNNGEEFARWNISYNDWYFDRYNVGLGTPVTITYSFPTSLPSYYNASDKPGFATMTSAQQAIVRQVLASISAMVNVTFKEVSGVGQMTFASHNFSDDPGIADAAAYSYRPSTASEFISISGDVWTRLDYPWTKTGGWGPGSEFYEALLHEIGHTLGLKHPFDGTFTLSSSYEDFYHTVMTYNISNCPRIITDITNTTCRFIPLFPTTLMPFDIEALQYLYGANTSTRSGNTTYRWAAGEEIFQTIWDGGGVDTIDCSNQTLVCQINLEAGAYSSIGLRQTPAEILSNLGAPSWLQFWQLPSNIYTGKNNLAIAKGVVIENAIGGTRNDILSGNSAANLLNGGAGNDTLIGGGGNDTLWGGPGNDVLSGDAGADTMAGGAGNDWYSVDNAGDKVIEYAGEGMDKVNASISFTLFANVEDLVLSGTNNINGAGNNLNNVITGNSGSNILNGGAGADTMSGGYGDDIYYVDNPGDRVVEYVGQGYDRVYTSISYIMTVNVEYLLLLGTANINATGNGLDNTLIGNSGNNILNGGAGNDTMQGGAGNDTYYVDNRYDVVVENPGGGTDTVFSSIAYTLGVNVERLALTGAGGISGAGNGLNNVITGNSGNNILFGLAGNDTLMGGAGDDCLDGELFPVTGFKSPNWSNVAGRAGADAMYGGYGDDCYFVDNAGDKVIEYAAQGYDRVYASITYILPTYVEFLWLQGSADINGTGNELNNYMVGNGGANTMYGLDGNDTLVGLSGNDKLYGGNGADQLSGDDGIDILSGGAGNDWLRGGAGNDTLTGGAGSDRFVFESVLDNGCDTISDFQSGSDRFILGGLGTLISEMRQRGSLPAYRFEVNNTGVATNVNDRIIYNLKTGALWYDADGSGAGVAVQFATLSNKAALKAGDFLAVAS